jgi:hypothetical protein
MEIAGQFHAWTVFIPAKIPRCTSVTTENCRALKTLQSAIITSDYPPSTWKLKRKKFNGPLRNNELAVPGRRAIAVGTSSFLQLSFSYIICIVSFHT